ncbi:PadR family transcriptional regulator [Kaistia sp. 32K]|uniref:PadR family transcriptional regulator n=1 Tax=Kaistia sp. 32K TaxID=2795690 RepID=UPI001914E1BC|nr:PadR family transcriptional regulator [Kaistia sp. 32K]BCP54210.1 PadR family transcriptional regulator [Kaistia sp. 32K]
MGQTPTDRDTPTRRLPGPGSTVRGRGGEGLRVGRMVADGDLRLVVLSLIERGPRHGYEIIKAIEELTSGSYSPSPGVIYPTLTAIETAGHATVATQGNKRVYSISDAGIRHLADRRAATDTILDHLDKIGRRIARTREWFDRGETALRDERPDRDIPGVVPELNDARRALKAAIAGKVGSSSIEQHRVAEILLAAVAAIQARSPEGDIDL